MELEEVIDKFYLETMIGNFRREHKKTEFLDITHNSMIYLELIYYQQNCTISHLAEQLEISKAGVSIKIQELEKMGYVVKVQSPKDKRVSYLEISATIKEEFIQQEKFFKQAIEETEKKYKQEELEVFCKVLKDLGYFLVKRYENE